MLKTVAISIAVMMAVPLASATPHYVKPKVKRVVVVPAKHVVPPHRVVIIKAPSKRAYYNARAIRHTGYTLKQLDRIEDRYDRLEDRLDARENRRNRRR